MTIDSRELRNAYGRFATGVCVITANPGDTAPFGMTVNSFAALSLDPPLLLWNLQNDSECFAAFEEAEGFTVNVLAHGQQDLSNACAKKGNHSLSADDFTIGESGLPILNEAIASFECKTWARYPGGDHVILVGQVEQMKNDKDVDPLVFYSGQYRGLGV
jgi:flavin reductase (DIM6/NTAB) family NADH-FMN oxidoreductase RutF